MNFFEAIGSCLGKYATFEGRASRAEFWWFALFMLIVEVATALVSQKVGIVAQLVLLLPNLAVSVRRIHDTDHSGWFVLLPFVNLFFVCQQGTSGPNRFDDDTFPS
jgi:uncharacterized membrane protein YhaH (DUF805 family)